MATRTFLALDLTAETHRRLGRVQARLAEAGAHVRWVNTEQIHVTVQFLGDVGDEDLPELCRLAAEVAATVEPFDFAVGRVIAAPPGGRMRMVWVEVADPTARMGVLHERLNDLAAGMGLKSETRRFRPHLTLGRIKGREGLGTLRKAIGEIAEDFGAQWADQLIVYASRLGRDGPVYTPLATAPLG